ncbi:MAG: Flp family type IVb pilin [Proteobacteria bacterium]|nr:Flp family type IVb pilin [Pseudomonadota bacterium]
MLNLFRRLATNDQGVTAIEYTLIASLIAVASIAAMRTFGNTIGNTFNSIGNTLTNTLPGGTAPGT